MDWSPLESVRVSSVTAPAVHSWPTTPSESTARSVSRCLLRLGTYSDPQLPQPRRKMLGECDSAKSTVDHSVRGAGPPHDQQSRLRLRPAVPNGESRIHDSRTWPMKGLITAILSDTLRMADEAQPSRCCRAILP